MAQRPKRGEKQLYMLTALPLFGLLGKCKEIFPLLIHMPFFLIFVNFHNVYFLVVICTISSIIFN